MTTTATDSKRRDKAAAKDQKKAEQAGGLPPTRSRRRPAVIAAGIALVIVGSLGAWYYATSARQTQAVFVTAVDIARGETIETSDLKTIDLDGRQPTDAIPVDRVDEVIGQVATVDLPEGSLLTPRTFDSTLAIGSGESLVGFTLTGAQMPSYPLSAGDTVRIVDTPVAQGDPPVETPDSFAATVFTVTRNADAGQWVVNVIVPKGQAADLAARAATGRVALVLDGGDQ